MRVKGNIRSILTLSIFALLLVLTNRVNAQCGTFSFSVNDTNICLNQVVTFKATNIPALSKYTWYLGLDTIQGQDKDTISTGYFKQGEFTVKLFIKQKNGDTCTIIKPKFIKVGKAPAIPNVTVNKSSLCDVNQSVKLNSNATGIAKWTWNVGQILYKDSTNSVTHKFIRTGYFDVGLTVEDPYGCKSTALYDSLVLVERKPQITLGVGDTSFCDTHTVFLNPSFNMYNQKGFKYSWDLKGSNLNGTANKFPGKLLYANRGRYGFKLEATSAGNCKYQYNFDDSLRIGKSVKLGVKKTTSAPCNQQLFNLEIKNASDLVNKPEWSFQGDSLTIKTTKSAAQVTYRKVGNFKFNIEHEDLGCVSSFSGINIVNLRSLNASFKFNRECSCSPIDTFKAINNSVGVSSTTTYNWRVFNSKDVIVYAGNAINPQVILNGYDVYSVQLNIADTSGCKDSLYKYGIIRLNEPNLALKAEPKVSCIGSDILLGVDSICESGFKSAEWNFYNSNNKLVGTSTDQYPIMSFADAGKYSAQLIYRTDKCTDTVYRKALFEVVNLQSINFTLSDTTPCEGAVINATLKVQPANIQPKVDWSLQHVSNAGLKFKATEVIGKQNEYLLKPNNTGIYDMKIVVNGGKGCKDSLLVSNFVKVSGIKADFSADNLVGCLPFKTTLRPKITKNEHYDNPTDNSLIYAWQVAPNTNATIKSPTRSVTDIEIEETGEYNVFLSVTNSDGCSVGVLKEDLFKFDFEALFSVDTSTCQNVKIHPTNNTPGTNISYKWFTNTTDVLFHTKRTIRQPVISFTKPGTFTLSLAASTKSGCVDTFTKIITVHPFSIDFSVNNSTPKCTPAQYIFNIKSNNVDTFRWKFGDGKSIVSDQKSIAHVYDLSIVKPFRNDFNVSLIGENTLGCVDTVSYEDLIKVLGPNPTFKIKVGEGCNPLNVEFIDSTEQVQRFYFNYDDGSSVDSVSFNQHTYVKKDTNKLFEVFKPYIIASDKNNCFVYYQPTDSIVVYSNPTSRFWTKKKKVCAPYKFDFKNHSKFSVESYWDYTNNGSIDDTLENGKTTLNAGTYSVKLITKNKIGCVDTLLRTRYLTLTEKPLALFNQSDTILCPKVPISFDDQSNATYPLKSWKWFFEGEGIKDSTFLQNPIKSFKDTGIYSATLITTDINGCSDTLIKPLRYHIVSRLPIRSPELYYITVEGNNTVNLQWNQLRSLGYKELRIIKDDDFANPVAKISNYKTINIGLSEPEVADRPVQYQLQFIDKCNDPDRNSLRHRTIHLTATRNEKPFARLTWTKYRGWETVDDYVVYRSETGRDFKEIARTGKNDTNFVDFTVCDKSYFYLIGSVNPVDNSITYSNLVEFNPFYGNPKDIVVLELVTVNENDLEVKWSNNSNLNVKNYFIDRYDDFGGWKKAYYETSDTFFLDNSVETHRLSYKYRVWYRDFCDNRNPPSNEGNSILLLGEISNEDFIYRWNPYNYWSNGVKNYIVEKTQDLSKPFVEASILDDQATVVIDNKKAIRSDSSFYVRVKAIEKGPNPDTSYSNIIKVYPEPVVYVPNAFTPNNDNINDVLSFDGLGFQRDEFAELSFRIYNRWGQKVFETEDYGYFWDGSFKNEECMEGVYTYYIQLRGVNNTIYAYSGKVLLFR